jgi:hypothetical protein
MNNTYTQLVNKHIGKLCIILGAGPSLHDLCISPYFKEILNYVVISINSAFMPLAEFDLDPEKHYWVSNDVLCRRWTYWKDVEKSNCTKVVRDSWLKYREQMSNTLFFSPRPTSEDIVNPKDVGLCYCSSGPTSLDLALQMGCKLIFLFGIDHNDNDRKHHFWQSLYDRKNRPTANANIYDSWKKQNRVFEFNDKSYKALKKFADIKKAEIYNCSNITKVTAFDRISIDYAFKLIGKK